MPIATTGEHTGVQTFVCIVEITVIAFLVLLNDPITAGGERTLIPTAVGIVVIAIITGLRANALEAVSAHVKDADVDAAIGILRISVIAFFDPVLHEPIPAGG